MADKGDSKSRGSKSKSSPQKKTPTTSPTTAKNKEVVTPTASKSPAVSSPPSPEANSRNSSTMAEELRRAAEDEKVLVEEAVNVEECEGAVGGEDGGSWSGWFTSTIASAKEKSNEMLQYLKQDLSEFTETVSEAGRDLKDKLKLEENANKAVTVVGEKVNVVLEQMSTIFGVGPDDEDEAYYVGSSGPHVVDRIQAKIYSLGLDEAVFLKDPEDMESYEKWLAHFDLEVKNDEIADLLTANPHLQLHYSQLVPDKVSHVVFWHRFYYRVQLIFDEEAQQKAKEKREIGNQSSYADEIEDDKSDIHNPSASGGGSGGDQGMVEISEEDQKRLLAEYEEELKKGDESGKHSRRSSGTQLSSSSSGSFAIVTHDPDTNELKVDE